VTSSPPSILFIAGRANASRGSENYLLSIGRNTDRNAFTPVALLPTEGDLRAPLEQFGNANQRQAPTAPSAESEQRRHQRWGGLKSDIHNTRRSNAQPEPERAHGVTAQSHQSACSNQHRRFFGIHAGISSGGNVSRRHGFRHWICPAFDASAPPPPPSLRHPFVTAVFAFVDAIALQGLSGYASGELPDPQQEMPSNYTAAQSGSSQVDPLSQTGWNWYFENRVFGGFLKSAHQV
jgi:hypothetical protein